MGPMYARFAILMHESAHRLLFSNKRVNDWVGHLAHRLPDLDPDLDLPPGPLRPPQRGVRPREPDIAFYGGYRCDRRTLARRLVRDAVGHLGLEELHAAVQGAALPGHPAGGRVHPRRAGAAVGRSWAATGRLVDLPAAVVAPVDDPVAGDQPAAGHRRARRPRGRRRPAGDHPQRAPVGWLARFWFVPYNTGWHLAHHVDMGIPFRNLPRLPRRTASGPATSPTGSPIPTTGPCGRRWRRPDRRDRLSDRPVRPPQRPGR